MRKARLRAALAIAALVALSRSAFAADTTTPTPKCNLLRYASLDMTTLPSGRVTVPMRVNGREVPFLVDTGGFFGGISSSLANAMKLRREPWPFGLRLVFYLRSQEKHVVGLDSIGFGPVEAKSVSIPVMPDNLLESDAYGLLAGNVLHGYDVEFDFFHEKLNVWSPDHCPGRVVYWADAWAEVPMTIDEAWHVIIPVTLDGHKLKALVDTGAAETVMTAEHAQDIFGWNPSTLKPMRGGGFQYPFASLKFEGIEVQHPAIRLIPKAFVSSNATTELLLGTTVLRQLRLYIAYKEKMLYLTSAEAQSTN